MATGSIVDYQVLQDVNVELDASTSNRELTRNISNPGDIERSRQAILAFKVRPFTDSDLSVVINGRPIFKTSFDASHTRLYWQVVSWNQVWPNNTNLGQTFPFRLIVEKGRLRLDDIIWWYQVKVSTLPVKK